MRALSASGLEPCGRDHTPSSSSSSSPPAGGAAWWLQDSVDSDDPASGVPPTIPRRRRPYVQRMQSTVAAVSALAASLRPFGEVQWWRVQDLMAAEAAETGKGEDWLAEEVCCALGTPTYPPSCVATPLQSRCSQVGKELSRHAEALRAVFRRGGGGDSSEDQPASLPVARFWRLAKQLGLASTHLPLDRIQPLLRLACSRGRERDALLALGAADVPAAERVSPAPSPRAGSPRGRRGRVRRRRSTQAGEEVRLSALGR